MKKILLLISLLVSVLTFAQNKGITYQAVIYNTSGESVPGIHNSNSPLVNKSICLQFSLVDENTQIEYQEKITVTTDDFGMVNLIIGNGTQTGGYASSYNAIIWSNANKYLKVSLDQSGNCSLFEEISNQVLTYVPFALAANSANNVSGVVSIAHGGTNATTVVGAKTNLQLQNVDNTSDLNKPLSTATQTALNTKVDKVAGKDLSTNDFTTAEKTKLASLGGIQDLSLYATLLSPTFLGTPTAPTASLSNNTTQIATTAFVNNAVANKFVDLTTNQTIAGSKTFNADINISGLIVGKGKGQNDYNTAFGAGALNSSNSTGTRNTAIGYLALTQYAGNTFDNNTGVGYFNMIGLTTGYGNTSIGAETMFNVGAASNNTGIGNQSLINASGDNNVGVGARSGDGLTTGTNNTFIGTQARTNSNTGTISNSTAIGSEAIVTTSNTIQLGNSSITSVKTSGSVLASGFKTPTGTSTQYLMADGSISNLSSSSSSSGVPYTGASGSVDLGAFDLKVNGLTVGIGSGGQATNVVVGKSAMENNTTGGYSVAVGLEALKSNTDGNSNTAIGHQALRSNTTGGANIAIGMNAMPNNTIGQQNIAIGQSTLYNNTNASGNTVIGNSAATDITTGGLNTIIGHETAGGLTTGSWNTIIGRNAYTGNISNNIVLSNGQGAIKAQHDGTNWTLSGITTATGFKTPSGTSSQYLMADGSVSSSTLSNYLPLTGGNLTGQLSIGTSSPQSSAVLNVNSTTQGFLPPRMTFNQKTAISTPVAGLVLWCTDCGAKGELQVYNGTEWTNMIGGVASIKPPVVGDSYAGGIVTYIFQAGDIGYVSGETHGLIIANTDQSTGIIWGPNTVTGVTSKNLGSGSSNTNAIVSSLGSGNYAAKICSDLVENGYSDWYLPSSDELYKMFLNRDINGVGRSARGYFSSSEYNSSLIWLGWMDDGNFTNWAGGCEACKSQLRYVRAFRNF